MEKEKIGLFLQLKGDLFPVNKHEDIGNRLANASETKWRMIYDADYKKPLTSLLLTIFLGVFGAHWYYLKNRKLLMRKLVSIILIGIGFGIGFAFYGFLLWIAVSFLVLATIVLYGCLFWNLNDIFTIRKKTQNYNYQYLLTLLN